MFPLHLQLRNVTKDYSKYEIENDSGNILIMSYEKSFTTFAALEREYGPQNTKLNQFHDKNRSLSFLLKIFSVFAGCFETTADHSLKSKSESVSVFLFDRSLLQLLKAASQLMLIQIRCNYSITRE